MKSLKPPRFGYDGVAVEPFIAMPDIPYWESIFPVKLCWVMLSGRNRTEMMWDDGREWKDVVRKRQAESWFLKL